MEALAHHHGGGLHPGGVERTDQTRHDPDDVTTHVPARQCEEDHGQRGDDGEGEPVLCLRLEADQIEGGQDDREPGRVLRRQLGHVVAGPSQPEAVTVGEVTGHLPVDGSIAGQREVGRGTDDEPDPDQQRQQPQADQHGGRHPASVGRAGWGRHGRPRYRWPPTPRGRR